MVPNDPRRKSKKLIGATRRFFGSANSGQLEEKAQGFGLTLVNVEPEPPFEVWPDNWETWLVFSNSQTQWKYIVGDKVQRIGFDYPGVKVVSEAVGVLPENWPEVFEGLQVCEIETLRIFNNKD